MLFLNIVLYDYFLIKNLGLSQLIKLQHHQNQILKLKCENAHLSLNPIRNQLIIKSIKSIFFLKYSIIKREFSKLPCDELFYFGI